MCAVSGILSSRGRPEEAILRKITDAQKHRGPDDSGLWISSDGKVGLGHRRLSIVDLSPTGKQPMTSHSGRYITVFNGEIYNFPVLRKELEGLGHRFRGTSDTEVMLGAFDQWGILEGLRKLNGMFAAGVWDFQDSKLYLFRDRLGVKPLFYQWHEGSLYFSSEMTDPFSKINPRPIDRNALAQFFRYNFIRAPQTIYQEIYKLRPGVVAAANAESTGTSEFLWTLPFWDTQERVNEILGSRAIQMAEEEALDLLDRKLSESILQRMIADVPLGAFLSGGIDSSLMVSYMAKLSTRPVKTFTIGFHEQGFDEAQSAKKISEYLKTEHTEFYVTERDALETVPALPRIYGEPFADSSQIPTYLVSKLTRQKVTVALSGDGGDELFAGYRYYQSIAKLIRYASIVHPRLTVALSKVIAFSGMGPWVEKVLGEKNWGRATRILQLLAGSMESELPPLLSSHFSKPETLVNGVQPGASIRHFDRCQGNLVEQAMCDDLMNYLPDDILVKVDRASMACSLEVRAPFVDDYELLETAWKIPFDLKLRKGGGGKWILKKLLARHIPIELFERPKQGFGIPLTHWLNGPLKSWMEDCTSPARIQREGFLNSATIEKIRAKTAQGDDGYAYTLWAICNFQSWLENRAA